MRVALALAFLVAACVTPLGASSVATSPETGAPVKASLRVTNFAPLTLHGTHFRSREPVRVVVTLPTGSLTRSLRVGLAGGFTVSFAGVRIERCGTPPEITARGVRTGLVRAFGLPRDCAMP
jgi:hypothetical protein